MLQHIIRHRVTNEDVRREIQAVIGEYDELLTMVKDPLAKHRA